MILLIVAIIVLILGLANINRINSMFNKPSFEELDNFQDSVFLHIDEEISNYKKEIQDIYQKEGKPMVTEVKALLKDVNDKMTEMAEMERRIDEKIIKLNQLKNIMK